MKTCDLTTNDCVCAPRQALSAKNLQIVTAVTDGLGRFWQSLTIEGELAMKQIALIFALAFTLTTGMALVTVVAHTDRAMADSAGTVILHPEQASQCDETNC